MPRFGRYEILDKLGEGAMGVVYRARDTALGRVVALKMLSADLVADEELHQRFTREAEAVGRLSHPNIVAVYDLGDAEGHLYMAMELLEGDDLKSLLERRIDVPLADRVRVMIQICEGLGYAHSRGVVHRDVKPANILVTSGGKVKILDFGLARVATRETITRRGMILGTPDYMSPEQAMGKDLDHRTDLFSAGSVFYEFLCRDKPFRGKTLHGVLYQIISDEPDPLLTVNPELPARLALVVHRMLRKDPAERYVSFDDVGWDLRRIHAALRRSRGQSSAPELDAGPAPGEDARTRVREHLLRGRSLLEADDAAAGAEEARQALTLDPDSADAAELLWRALRRQWTVREAPAPSPAAAARISDLLSRAAPGTSDAEAKRALAELALIAPDDPRLVRLIRERAGKE